MVEAVAELSAEMAVDVVLLALLPLRSWCTAVLAASIASPCEHSQPTPCMTALLRGSLSLTPHIILRIVSSIPGSILFNV